MKKVVVAAVVSGLMSTSAFAADDGHSADANRVFSTDNTQTMELTALSDQEMTETKGALFDNLGAVLSNPFGFVVNTSLKDIRQQVQAKNALRLNLLTNPQYSFGDYLGDRANLAVSFITASQ